MSETKGKLPQHFVSGMIPAPTVTNGGRLYPHTQPVNDAKKEWPEEWKKNPELLRLVSEHQNWLANPTTERLHKVLDSEFNRLVASVAAISTTFAVSSEHVRVVAGLLSELIEIRKLIFDTEAFISKLTNQ